MKITFEGYVDQKAGWDFMAPLLLVKPVIQMHDVGNIGEADRVVDDHIEAISLGEEPRTDETIDRSVVLRDFRKAIKGSKRFFYFRKEVTIPDDIDWDSDDPFARIEYGDLQTGAASGAQSVDDALRHFAHDLASKQQPMDPECRDVLYNNLGELLSDDASGAADGATTTEG